MLVGSVANGLCSAGGFCAGSSIVTEHQVGYVSDEASIPLITFHLTAHQWYFLRLLRINARPSRYFWIRGD